MQIINDCVKENTLFFEINGKCRSLSKIVTNMELCCELVNKRLDQIDYQIKMMSGQVKIEYKPTPNITINNNYYPSIKIVYMNTYNIISSSRTNLKPYNYIYRYSNKVSKEIKNISNQAPISDFYSSKQTPPRVAAMRAKGQPW